MKTESKIKEHVNLLASTGKTPASVRFQAAKYLRETSVRSPQLLYPYFDFFAGLLRHENSILRWNAILTLANLAPVDTDCRLDPMLDAYLAPIRGPYLIDAANTIRGAAVIAAAKPQLAAKIVKQILKVERASYATPECRNVAIGHAIVAFEGIMPLILASSSIRNFVSRQKDNPRPATRKKAEKLLRKFQNRD